MAYELAAIDAADGLLVHNSRSLDETLSFLHTSTQRLSRLLAQTSARQLFADGTVRTWSAFCALTKPPEPVTSIFGRMLLNIHGLSAPMIGEILRRYPTPRALAEALDDHQRGCAKRGLPTAHAGWLLADELVPGKRRRKMSEVITDFFCRENVIGDVAP